MKAIIASLSLLALAACSGGLPSAGQIQVEGTVAGLSAGTDPINGGLSATLGYKHGRGTYNPNAKEGGDSGPDIVLSSKYGNAEDARSMFTWKDGEAQAGSGEGVIIGAGDGAAFGSAAFIFACGTAQSTGERFDCMAAYE